MLLLGQPWLAAAVLLILPAGALLNRVALRLSADERGVVVLNRDGALAMLGVVVGTIGAVIFAWAVQLLITLLYAMDVALTGV